MFAGLFLLEYLQYLLEALFIMFLYSSLVRCGQAALQLLRPRREDKRFVLYEAQPSYLAHFRLGILEVLGQEILYQVHVLLQPHRIELQQDQQEVASDPLSDLRVFCLGLLVDLWE